MSEKILEQGAGYTIACTNEASTAVPYASCVHEDGNKNHGFLNLQDRSKDVELIPETKKSPGLKKIIEKIASNPNLMSIGCEIGFFQDKNLAFGECYYGSYIDIAFRSADRNKDKDEMIKLAKKILENIQPSSVPNHQIWFELIIAPLKTFFGHPDCHSLSLRIFGGGHDEASASESYEYAALECARVLNNPL